jgi:CRISPR/Cas system-associated exonuclease Cas4 (RecB family)
MDIHWSPRKRIKLGSQKVPDSSGVETQPVVVAMFNEKSPKKNTGSKIAKRVSRDFARELDELLEQPDGGFNPTQVFLVDPDMELAMLRADIDQPIPSSLQENPKKRAISQTLSGRDSVPLTDTTNTLLNLEVKRHWSDPVKPIPSSFLVDELDGIDINELTAAIETAENHLMKQNGAQASTQECTQTSSDCLDMFSSRCVVEEIPIYSSELAGVGMRLKEESTGHPRFVTLQGVWLASYMDDPWQVQVGDTIHLLAAHKSWIADHIIIGDSESLFPDVIVFHPDCVISSTTLSASATCSRRSVIQNRVLAPSIGPAPTDEDEISRSLSPIIGNCVHEAVQAAAAVGDFSEFYVMEAGEKALRDMMLSDIWACGAGPLSVMSQLRLRLGSISRWGQVHWPKIAKSLRGCETEIRPKSLGVTGKLDMDIEDCTGARSCIEIKTGKPHAIHVGQVVLYYLLQYVDKHGNPNRELSAKLPAEISQEYLLLYLPAKGEAETIKVKITAREAQNIMRNRNLVASHTVRKTLPPPISKKGDCQFCPTRTECTAMYMSGLGGTDDDRFLPAVCYQKRTSTALCDSSSVLKYQRFWLDWIDSQPTNEALGGLSAVRRMRGNLLHMVTACLLKASGPHEGTEAAFFNYMPLLTLAVKHSMGMKSLCEYMSGYNPRTRVGRAVCIHSRRSEEETADQLVGELISPLLLQKERVLVCGTSHGLVDSVLEALLSAGLGEDILSKVTRLASKPEDVVESVRERMLIPKDWAEKADEFEKSRLMYACTVKAVHHDILSRGDFNVAVVLGADRTPDALLWGVMLRSRQVVLVGSDSQEDNTETMIFHRLVNANKSPVVQWDSAEVDNETVVVIDD